MINDEALSEIEGEANLAAYSDLVGCGPALSMARLVSLLRSEHAISSLVRRNLADALEGKNTELQLVAKRTKAGNPANISERSQKVLRDWQAGEFINNCASGQPPTEADYRAAEIEFGMSRTSAKAAYKTYRKFVGACKAAEEAYRLQQAIT